MPHGVIMDQFWPADAKSFLESPPPALESLRPVLDQCLTMKGVSGVPIAPFNGAPHALELSTWLTATLPAADKRNEINIAISADQIAANHVGAFTTLPSLELATMPQDWKENQEGLNEAYYSHCSFRAPTQALPAEDQSAQRAQPPLPPAGARRRRARIDKGKRARPKLAGHRAGGCEGSCGRRCRPPTSASLTNTWTASARSNDASPPSSTARRRRPWRRPASGQAGVARPIRRPSRSRFPRATSVASTCR